MIASRSGENETTKQPIERLLLRKEELAQSLGISARTIQEWETNYGLPTLRLGSSVRYSPKQVAEWIDRLHEQEANHGT